MRRSPTNKRGVFKARLIYSLKDSKNNHIYHMYVYIQDLNLLMYFPDYACFQYKIIILNCKKRNIHETTKIKTRLTTNIKLVFKIFRFQKHSPAEVKIKTINQIYLLPAPQAICLNQNLNLVQQIVSCFDSCCFSEKII